jgi:uncharacterized protein YcbK (DUF882 family)
MSDPLGSPGMERLAPSRRELLIATGLCLLFGGRARAEPSAARRLKLKNANTGETFEGPYRDAVGPIPAAMEDLAVLLRDHHVNQVGPVHVDTLDFLADVMSEVGIAQATILSAFRTPETNAKLAAEYFGVAEKSQHLVGRALDVTFETGLGDAHTVARKMERGGVGWYPRSNFIHLDTGPLRNWERDGNSLDILLAGGTRHPLAVAERHGSRPVASIVASAAHLPPCRQTVSSGVLVIRGTACTP